MRLWSIHPKYLDSKGLVSLWRESLLAQAVLHGQTKGYRFHPQLKRFRQSPDPLLAINIFLANVWREAKKRRYNFDSTKISPSRYLNRKHYIPVSLGQVQYEFRLLQSKLRLRNPSHQTLIVDTDPIEVNPIFSITPGSHLETWEKPILGVYRDLT